jgi:hypothetical protein
MSSFTILPNTGYKFIILPETTVSVFEALELNDQLYMSEQEKTEAQNIYRELCQQLKEQYKTEQEKKAELEARNAELEARNAELEVKLQLKDQFILEYWKKINNLLIAEKKKNKELEGRNADLEIDLDWYHKQCSRQRSCDIITELPA